MTDEQWQSKCTDVKKRNAYLLNTGFNSDCQIFVGKEKKRFIAHKLLVSSASPAFDKIFSGDADIFTFQDADPSAFYAVLRYIYVDETPIVSIAEACNICYIAEKYMMPHLVEICYEFIQKKLDFSNVCRAYEFAVLFNRQSLIALCKRLIVTRTAQVIQHPSFEDIQKETLHMILDQDKLTVTRELQLYDASIRWIKAKIIRNEIKEEDEKQMLYDEILSKIRYICMKPKEFADGPAVHGFIREADVLAIFVNICSTKPQKTFPAKYQVGNWNCYRYHLQYANF